MRLLGLAFRRHTKQLRHGHGCHDCHSIRIRLLLFGCGRSCRSNDGFRLSNGTDCLIRIARSSPFRINHRRFRRRQVLTIIATTIESTKGGILKAFTILFETIGTSTLAPILVDSRASLLDGLVGMTSKLFVKSSRVAFQNGLTGLFNRISVQGRVVTRSAFASGTTSRGRSKALTIEFQTTV